ncbi:MAG: ABC transporter ATP-binding protein, partial [Candidatus Rokubacteria bacterium]|nr:ABC transporter ATP-binding protein [Candidatus Rokubacteria bacterium]
REVLALHCALVAMPRDGWPRAIGAALVTVGLDGREDGRVGTFSKGMQQRLGLAVALLGEPELVLLDEPTSALDPVGRHDVREVIRDLRSRGVTVFLNSHLLTEVELVCDRVAIMSKGRLIREGSVDELTPRTGKVQFELRDKRADLATLMAGIGTGFGATAGGFELKVTESELDQAIDRLRAAAVGIREITQRRLTLEESFIHLVSGEQG